MSVHRARAILQQTPPVLIIGFARPAKILKLIDEYVSTGILVYIFIDKCESGHRNYAENLETIALVNSLKVNSALKVKIAESNLGVGAAVPEAINWVMQYESRVVAVEDDCEIPVEYLSYFENVLNIKSQDIVVVSAINPKIFSPKNSYDSDDITTSTFPLIWGWGVLKEDWVVIRRFLYEPFKFGNLLTTIKRNPKNIPAVFFFYSSYLRVTAGLVNAWDSTVALALLHDRTFAAIPNISLVTNTGADSSAHNIVATPNDLIVRYEIGMPSARIDPGQESRRLNDETIKNFIYGVKILNVLSPIKAMVEIYYLRKRSK
jgi:hypothetical protein